MSPESQQMLQNVNQFVTGFGLLDIILIILLLAGLLNGYRKGFSVVIIRVVKLLFVVVVTLQYYEAILNLFPAQSPILSFILGILSFLLIVVVSYFCVKFIFELIARVFTIRFTDVIDKIFGALFGGFFFVVLLSFICSFALIFPGDWFQETSEKSNLSGPFLLHLAPDISQTARRIIPEPLRSPVDGKKKPAVKRNP